MYSVVWYSVFVVTLLQESYVIGSRTQLPSEEYALLEPKTGCPDPKNWKDKAWIIQDTRNTERGRNTRSEILHIAGYVARNYVVRSFCIKSAKKGSSVWPKGKYCIYGNLLHADLLFGSIKMAGEHDDNKDAVKYTGSFVEYHDEKLPKRVKRHLEFHFSCQTRGNKKKPISLPITKPFYLLPYGSRDCQQVKWMVATSEWIKYHTRNAINGTLPFHTLKDTNGITMFYCYYKSCNYTLKDKKGVFQSPGFPGKYPDGQLCSWRVMVPDNHTLHVHFTNFSLSLNDTLRYSKRINGSFKPWYTIPISHGQFTLSSDSDVRFVFRSNNANTSTGFRAEYRVFIPQVTTAPTVTPIVPSSTPSVTTSMPSTTPRETTKDTLKTTKRQDLRITTQNTNPESTVTTKIYVSTTKPQKTKPEHESSTPINCTIGDSVRKPLRNSSQWQNKKFVVIVIPLACLIVILLIVDIVYIVYCCRSKRKNSTKASETRSVDQLPLVVNPTYERGDIILNHPKDTTTFTTILEVNENGTGIHQPVTDRPPDYEDVECWKPNKATPNKDLPEIPECNGSNVQGESPDTTTTEKTSKISENPFYESVLNAPPLVEANKLYESIKIDQGRAN